MKLLYSLLALVVICIVGCASVESENEDEREIALSSAPKAAVKAAQDAVPGITLTEAEVEEEDGRTVYEFEGIADGTEYEIEVTADGKVLEVEKEDDDDEDDDDDDDDDK